jgi:membrane-associated phospholipid phosphatase
VIVAAGGILVHGRGTPLGIEIRIQRSVDRHLGGVDAWSSVFSFTIPDVIKAVFIALLVWSLAHRSWRGLAACAAVPLAIPVTAIIKQLVDRRPPGTQFLYPSGHITGLAAATTLVLLLVAPRLRPAWARIALAAGCLVVCVGGMLAAVAGHKHGPLDSLAGLPTGAAIVGAWALIVDAVADTALNRKRPASP